MVIPKEIIYDTDIDNKRVLLFSYLCCRRTLDDTVAFSIGELCKWSDMKPNRQHGKINDKFITLLSDFSKKKYFIEHPDFKSITLYDTSTYYNMKLDITKFDNLKHFGLIYFEELRKIINFKKEVHNKDINLERITSAHILLVLAYLRLNMYRKPDKPMCCYRFYEKISQDIGISERYVGRVVEILDDLKIIKYKEAPRTRYKNKQGQWSFNTGTKVFADYKYFTPKGEEILEYDCDDEIQTQIEILTKERKMNEQNTKK